MSNTRKKPYESNPIRWESFLKKVLYIPMNQREYSWGNEEITKFMLDLFKIFEEEKYIERMGSIILLKYKDRNEIYDGQQRILTTILILVCIGHFHQEKLDSKIKNLLTFDIDTDMEELTDKQKEYIETGMEIIPKISCVNPKDMQALYDIFNGKIDLLSNYIENDDFLKSKIYIPKKNKEEEFDDIRKFKNYIIKYDNYLEREKESSNLYNAFECIYNFFRSKQYSKQDLIKLYKFILYDIDIQQYECTDPEYVSVIFDWENNRGKSVETLDIIKNPILIKIDDKHRLEVYEKWENLKNKKHDIYKNYGQKLFDIAIQIYNRKIVKNLKKEEAFKTIIEAENTYKEIKNFFSIVENLSSIMDKIKEDKYGRIITNKTTVSLAWEAYMFCILPVFYIKKIIDKKLIELFTKWLFRNLGFKNQSFASVTYTQKFIEISNKLFKKEEIDYYKEIKICFYSHIATEIKEREDFLKNYKQKIMRETNAKYIFLFLETKLHNISHTVSLKEYDIEHIFPKKNNSSMKNLNNLGNLTLLEGKNSPNNHKGNRSIKTKEYKDKKESYKKSESLLTKNLVENYENFTEEDILTRNQYLVRKLEEFTRY